MAGSRDTGLAVVMHQVLSPSPTIHFTSLFSSQCHLHFPQPEHTFLTALARQEELPRVRPPHPCAQRTSSKSFSYRPLSQGELGQFRLRVMEEHLGQGHPSLLHPHTRECNQWVREVCETNWQVRRDVEEHVATLPGLPRGGGRQDTWPPGGVPGAGVRPGRGDTSYPKSSSMFLHQKYYP